MAEVVSQSTRYLSEPDLRAIAVYLKSLPAPPQDDVADADAAVMRHGAALYLDNCEGCHLRGGTGETGAFPRLRDSSAIQAEQPDTLIATILRGDTVPATDADPTGLAMPAFDKRLDDGDIAALATYIRQAWGNRAGTVSSKDVKDLREKLHRNPN
jgi:mono/diheme cytochrome c family protein